MIDVGTRPQRLLKFVCRPKSIPTGDAETALKLKIIEDRLRRPEGPKAIKILDVINGNLLPIVEH